MQGQLDLMSLETTMIVGTTLNRIWADETEGRAARGKPFWENTLHHLDMMAMDHMVLCYPYQAGTEWDLGILQSLLLTHYPRLPPLTCMVETLLAQ